MEPRLIQQQSQRLILSPQIRQYLRLLQLPLLELQQAVEVELAQNPVLEEKPSEISDSDYDLKSTKGEDTAREILPGQSFDTLNQMDESFQEGLRLPDFSRQSKEDLAEIHNYQETLMSKPEVLTDYLMSQTRFLDISETEKYIALEIIGSVDENGYLRTSIEDIASHCGAALNTATSVLEKIQSLDPPGIAARNLQECLLIQLTQLQKTSPTQPSASIRLAILILKHYLPQLEKRDYPALIKSLNSDMESVKKAVEVISKLDPRPGRGFQDPTSLAVTPDAAIVPDEDREGKYIIEIHNEKIPEIRISPYYRKMLRQKNLDEKTKLYLKDKVQSALNFMQAIQLRKSTLREITEAISAAQLDFIEKGFLHLKPLRLKDIANQLAIHESTVSRAIQGKYVSTPQGTIPYKSFFSTRMETSEGPAESQKSIMEKIKFLIAKEAPEHPLSDQEILMTMKQDGIVIARRTVAKYRDLLKILPSHMRRRK